MVAQFFILSADCRRPSIFHRPNIKQMNINNHKSYSNINQLSRYQASAVHLIHTKSSSAHHEHLCIRGEYHWQERTGELKEG